MKIRGRVAIVTGASAGLGRATALRLAERGADVGLVARRTEELREAAREVSDRGGRAATAPCDVADPQAVAEAHRKLCRELGEVDILVNAAGIGVWKPFLEVTDDEHRRMMATNYWGTYHWIRQVLPGMRRRRAGRIVNVSSGSGLFALPVTSGYSASKFAVTGLSEALHRELSGSGVGVSCLHPGSIRTDFWRNEDVPAELIPPLIRYSPKLSPSSVARSVEGCIRFGFPVRTVPIFVALTARLNALWVRLGDLVLWRWFVPVLGVLVALRVLLDLLDLGPY